MELWQATLGYIVACGVTSEPWGRDRGRVEELFAELYLIGERPSVESMRGYLQLQWPGQSLIWQREIIRLWRKRLKKPAHRHASVRDRTSWAYPFVVLELLIAEHGLPGSVADRLIAALEAAAREAIRSAEVEPAAPGTQDAADVLALTYQAVRLWTLSRDRAEDARWPSITSRVRGPDGLAESVTLSGRARANDRLERWKRDWAAQQQPEGDS